MAKAHRASYIGDMADTQIIPLNDRALVSVRGADWRSFLQGLLTNDVETLGQGEIRFAALLTPQGRILFDLFVIGEEGGALLDVGAEQREAFIERLTMYRLRAKVEIKADDRNVAVDLHSPITAPAPIMGEQGLMALDPRLPELGWRLYGAAPGAGQHATWEAHRMALGAPSAADWGSDATYPIEADFDLLNGIDFQKGCFVGQETTSRMKRRGEIRKRMAPILFEGPPPPRGTEVLAGDLRAGEVLSGIEGRAMALLRLDRAEGALSVDGREASVDWPEWMER